MPADESSPARRKSRYAPVLLSVTIATVVCLLVTAFVVVQLLQHVGHSDHTDTADHGPLPTDYVNIGSVPITAATATADSDASTGSYAEHCGDNAGGQHRNADNVIADPDLPGGAHHVHDYVGNLSTNAFSTDTSLAAAATTCANGDKSTFYWPVLRLLTQPGTDANQVGGGLDGNLGRILTPNVDIEFVGSPVSQVVPMPEFLRSTIGDPKALTDGLGLGFDEWTCTGYTNRVTEYYPLCPSGSDVERIFDFPSCWNGTSLDSTNHHTHLVSAAANGACPAATFPVPKLRIVLTYSVPPGDVYAIDSFPEQLRSPLTDHADFIDVMTDAEQNQIVTCINTGQHC